MTSMRFRHIALFVGPRLRQAERYYADLFDMRVSIREAPVGGDGAEATDWAQLPPDQGWDDAEAAGAEIGMVVLERDDVILALFAAQADGRQFYAIGLVMEPDEIIDVRRRLEDETVESSGEGWLAFVDRFGVRWQLSDTAPFLGAGMTSGRWLEI